MSSTVTVGEFTVESNSDAASMVESLRPQAEKDNQPRVVTDRGVPVKDEPESELSKAASELGKKGGEAAAKARKVKPIPDKKAAPEAPAEEPAEEPAPEAAAAEEATEAPPEPTERENKARAQARVEKATRETAEARREAAELRQRLDAIERERRPHPPEAKAQPEGKTRPQPGDFESYDGEGGYMEALADWKVEQRLTQMMEERQKQAAIHQREQGIHEAKMAFADSLVKAAKADPTLPERVSAEVLGLEVSIAATQRGLRPNGYNWIADELLSSPERAPYLMLHLSEQPDEFRRIAALTSPRAVTREMAILGVGLDATAGNPSTADHAAPKPQTSKASPPVRPVTGAPSVADGNPAPRPGESFDEWNRRTSKR